MKRKIRVLIIEDSRLYQKFLEKVISADNQLEVAGVAGSGKEALEYLETQTPDIVTLDLHLPDMDGLELMKRIHKQSTVPVIIVTSQAEDCEKTMELGASDFIAKMEGGGKNALNQFALLLKLKIKMNAGSNSSGGKQPSVEKKAPVQLLSKPKTEKKEEKPPLILIGASLGGTEATLAVLRELPEDMPGILLVQHMPEGFTKSYALRLNKNCRLKVEEARNGQLLKRGSVLLAKAGKHMTVRHTTDGYRVYLSENKGESLFCPSVDVLFHSAAEAAGAQGIGVILTGMGHDGAAGLLHMHESGAYTIAQNEETCAVFGMPAAAIEMNAVDQVLPLEQIHRALIKLGRGG